jgi:L-lactate dehydrogenase complex protein LldE
MTARDPTSPLARAEDGERRAEYGQRRPEDAECRSALSSQRVKVSLFITCLADQLFPEVGVSTVRVLRKLGCEVDFPKLQTCCGQPAFNAGFAGEARSIARNMLDAFESSEHVVAPSGSCVGMVKHYYPELFASDAALERRARDLAARTWELSQFLVDVLGRDDLGARFPHRATYHPSCHASRLLGAREEPLRLLANVKGLELVPLERAEDCCGFGGLFSVKLPDVSAAMLAEKCEHVADAKPEYVIGTDMGCLMNIAGWLSRKGSRVEAIHLANVLDHA